MKRQSILRQWPRGLTLVLALGIVVFVSLSGSHFWIYNLTLVAIYGLAVVGLNLLVGYLGVMSFAQTAFMAVGGYSSAILGVMHHWNPWLAMGAGAGLAVVASLVVGLPLLRLKGHYLTMATFAFAVAVYSYAGAAGVTGGAVGISSVPALDAFGISFANPVPMLLLSCGICGLGMLVVWLLLNSYIGRSWRALASRPDVASSLGIRSFRVRLVCLILAGVFASIAGSLYVEAT
jgi:branched-chain amino acid transport system permease protein